MANLKESVSSFQKNNIKRNTIQGTRISLRNAQLLTSSGISTFDHFTGGGLPMGTVCCIEEDISGVYSKLMLKHFVAEGVLNGHRIFLSSLDKSAEEMIQELPCSVNDGTMMSSGNTSGDQMKIAWRYENLNSKEMAISFTPFGHIFDTSKIMPSEKLTSAHIKYWCHGNPSKEITKSSLSEPYLDLLYSIRQEMEDAEECKVNSSSDKKNVLRIALHSLASPLWSEQTVNKSDYNALKSEFLTFVYYLKALLRACYSVCLLTVPTHLFQDTSTLPRLRDIVDLGIKLEAFADSEEETNEVYKDYLGLIHFTKLFSINTVVPHTSQSIDLAFKMKRKRFTIEKLALFPELMDQRSKDGNPRSGCSANSINDGRVLEGMGSSCRSIDF